MPFCFVRVFLLYSQHSSNQIRGQFQAAPPACEHLQHQGRHISRLFPCLIGNFRIITHSDNDIASGLMLYNIKVILTESWRCRFPYRNLNLNHRLNRCFPAAEVNLWWHSSKLGSSALQPHPAGCPVLILTTLRSWTNRAILVSISPHLSQQMVVTMLSIAPFVANMTGCAKPSVITVLLTQISRTNLISLAKQKVPPSNGQL